MRNRVVGLGGRCGFPLLVEPVKGKVMYQSRRIREYLWQQRGERAVPETSSREPFDKRRTVLASIVSFGKELYVKLSRRLERLLEFFCFESSPYSWAVHERLSKLEISYVLRNCGKSRFSELLLSAIQDWLGIGYQPRLKNRQKLLTKTGPVAVSYLVDPNQGIALYESRAMILAHLRAHYQI